MKSALLLVGDDCVRVYRKATTKEMLCFNPATEGAVKKAADSLINSGIISACLLLDLPDEEFFLEKEESRGRWVTAEQLQTRLRRKFPASNLARVHVCRSLPKTSGNLQVMTAGIRQSSVIESLMETLQHYGLAVSGAYSLSISMMNLLQPEMGAASEYRFLISSGNDRHWRYSLYFGQTLLFSRCAVGRARDPWADIYNETRETLKYARDNGLLPDTVKPGFYYLASLMPLTVLGMHLQKKLGLKHPLRKSPSGSLYELCAARFNARSNPMARYDRPALTSPYRKLLAAHTVLALSLVSCGLALWSATSYLDKSLATASYSDSLQANIHILQNRTEEQGKEISSFGVDATELEQTVKVFRDLDREGDLRELLLGMGAVLTDFPQIRLEKLRWVRFSQGDHDSGALDMNPRNKVGQERHIRLLAELSVRPFSGALQQQEYRESFMTALRQQGVRNRYADNAGLQNQFRSGAIGQHANTTNNVNYSFEVLLTHSGGSDA